ncbi:MAG: trigger factor [Spirochaetaceae bacterium]|nr:trigger factor [Spirochaetaceae bacterium]
MIGTHEIQRLEHSVIKLTIKLTKDEVRAEYNKYLKDTLKDLSLPGFRRGKVPVAVFEKKAGPAIKEDVLNHIVGVNVTERMKSGEISQEDMPLGNQDPQLDGEPKLDLDSDLEFSVHYDAAPQFKLVQWEGFEVEIPDCEVDDEDVQHELENLRERNAVVMDRDDTEPAQKGDVVTIDYSEWENGAVVESTKRDNFVWTLGTGANYFQIDDEIVGMKKNETRDLVKTLPDDFEDKEYAGKTKNIHVKLKGIKEKKLPDLDDDLAQDVDEKFNTLDDLKKNVREQLEMRLSDFLAAAKQDALLSKIIEANPIELPETLITAEIVNSYQKMKGGASVTQDEIESFFKKTPNIAEMWRPKAEKHLQSGFIINELLKLQQIEVTEEDREEQIERYSKQSGTPVEQIKKIIAENPQPNNIDSAVKERKIFELLEAKNTVTKGQKKKYLELFPEKE